MFVRVVILNDTVAGNYTFSWKEKEKEMFRLSASSVVVEWILHLALFLFYQASCELWWQHWCPAQHTGVTSEASTKKENDECLPAGMTSSKVGVLLISPSDQVLMFGCAVNTAKDVVYPPCFLKAISVSLCHATFFLTLSRVVESFKHAKGWHIPRHSNGPLLMETDDKSFDMKFSYLVVGCAAVLRGAEPIPPSNGVYQPLCTHISNPWIKKKKKKYKAMTMISFFICLHCLHVHMHIQGRNCWLYEIWWRL